MKLKTTGDVIRIEWSDNLIEKSNYESLVKIIMTHDYSLLHGKDLVLYHNAANGLGISDKDADSIRSIILKSRIIKAYPKLNKNIERYRAEYLVYDIDIVAGGKINATRSPYESNREHQYHGHPRSPSYESNRNHHQYHGHPPLILLRLILAKYYDSKTIQGVFSGALPPSNLNGRDQAQYRIACKIDAEASFNQRKVAEKAAENETIFANYFRDLDISFKTEDELAAEQISKHGRAIITPDILFSQPVFINDIRVYWMDFKDYTCTDGFILGSNMKQAARYNAEWGPGAIVYNGGILEGVVVKDTQLLSANCLRIDFKR